MEDVGRQVRERWVRFLPELDPTSEPKGGKTLAGGDFRTLFHSGQPSKNFGPKMIDVYQFTIRLEATGKWIWDFDDGEQGTFYVPGSKYPDKTVGHPYTEIGEFTPTVRTEWKGKFWVGGQGPWEIDTPATQAPKSLDLEVVESLPVLGGN